jgi:hypothetical protein
MLIALLLACAPPDDDGYVLRDDTAGDTEAYSATFPCDGLTVTTPGGPIGEVCVTCSGTADDDGACTWQVGHDATVASVEMEARASLDVDPEYAEYDGTFSATTVEGVAVSQATLDLVSDPAAYESGVTTYLDVRDADILALFSVEISSADAGGSYVDCVAWGADPTVFGDSCRAP